MYLLDTNICIAYLNGKEGSLVQKIRSYSPADFHLCSVVKAELLYGAHKSKNIAKNISVLEIFFSQFSSFSFDDSSAEFYGKIRALLAQSGTPIGSNDLLIASIAQTNNLTVLTRNQSEFIRIPGLRVESW